MPTADSSEVSAPSSSSSLPVPVPEPSPSCLCVGTEAVADARRGGGASCGCCGGGACDCGDACRCSCGNALCRCAASGILDALRGESSKSRQQRQLQRPPCPSTTGGASPSPSFLGSGEQQQQLQTQLTCCATKKNSSKSFRKENQELPRGGGRRLSRTELEVDGMTCSMCAQAVEAAVRGLNGLSETAAVSYGNGADGAVAGDDPLCLPRAAVSRSSSPFSGRILDVKVSLTTDTVLVEWEEPQGPGGDCSAATAEQRIIDAIQGVGYTVAGVLSSGGTHRISSISSCINGDSSTCRDGSTTTTTTTGTLTAAARSELPPSPAARLNSENGAGDHDWETVQRRWDRLRERQRAKVRQRRDAFLLSLFLALPVLVVTMVLPQVSPGLSRGLESIRIRLYRWQIPLQALLLFIFASITQFWCGFEFYRGAFFSFRVRKAGMDLLVMLGTSASYLYAIRGMMSGVGSATDGDQQHQHWAGEDATHFFETSTTLIAFVLAGKWMQASAVQRTGSALASLLELRSSTAIKITPFKDRQNFDPLKDPYKEATVPIEDVREGDLVKILPGNSVPADGKVVFGQVCVDESMLTGESIPVYKATGAVVLGGTICVESSTSDPAFPPVRALPGSNSACSALPADSSSRAEGSSSSVGAAFVQVTGVGAATALSQIIKLVTDAQLVSSATPIQNVADTVASYFVPTVVALSVATTLGWYAACRLDAVPPEWYGSESAFTFSLLFGIAVLVISCPCALGLATPTAIMVGTGVGAKLGVLVKSGQSAETAAKVTAVSFDKTGTLTQNEPIITDVYQLDELGVLMIDGALVDASAVPAEMLRRHLLWLLASMERNSTHPLAKAVVSYARDRVRKPLVQPTNFRALTGRGASALVDGTPVACGNRAFAQALDLAIPRTVEECMVSLEDEGKTAILAAINNKVCVVMGIADEIKPDAATSVAYLQERLKVDVWMVTGDNRRTAHSVAQQGEGHVVCFVGDGINDSPAMVQADVGMSVGTGTEIAAEASDMVLVAGKVSDVCTALHLSRTIFRRIQWNFVWSLMYNCLGIPIAAGVFYPLARVRLPPPVAAISMALSSISVVLSSMALRLYHPPRLRPSRRSQRSRFRSASSATATTVWDRIVNGRRRPRRIRSRSAAPNVEDSQFDASLGESLLEDDHLLSTSTAGDATESTRCTDNRTASRMETGALE